MTIAPAAVQAAKTTSMQPEAYEDPRAQPTGVELYAYAGARAKAAGWRLNLDIKGHRVCDFPRAIYRARQLGEFERGPAPGIWVLEIQIAHPTPPFGPSTRTS